MRAKKQSSHVTFGTWRGPALRHFLRPLRHARHRTAHAKHRRAAGRHATPVPAKRRTSVSSQIPANGAISAPHASAISHAGRGLRSAPCGNVCGDADPRHRRRPATSARRSSRALAARRPRRARLRPLAARVRGRRRRSDRAATRVTGAGLDEALDGVDVAYYLIHSMEGPAAIASPRRERRARGDLRRGRAAAGVRRVVYLGGLVPARRARLAPPRLAAWRSRRRCWTRRRSRSRCAPRS